MKGEIAPARVRGLTMGSLRTMIAGYGTAILRGENINGDGRLQAGEGWV